jgi:hypothetical protein
MRRLIAHIPADCLCEPRDCGISLVKAQECNCHSSPLFTPACLHKFTEHCRFQVHKHIAIREFCSMDITKQAACTRSESSKLGKPSNDQRLALRIASVRLAGIRMDSSRPGGAKSRSVRSPRSAERLRTIRARPASDREENERHLAHPGITQGLAASEGRDPHHVYPWCSRTV